MAYGIVVDTSIARSASDSPDSVASRCHACLEALSGAGHLLVMTQALREEWFRVASGRPSGGWQRCVSRYASTWYTDMVSRRRIIGVHPRQSEEFRRQVLAAVDADRRERARKDLHLVEAALAADNRVLSRDHKARTDFDGAATSVSELRPILWVDALRHQAPQWLSDGAQDLPKYRLGYRAAPGPSPL